MGSSKWVGEEVQWGGGGGGALLFLNIVYKCLLPCACSSHRSRSQAPRVSSNCLPDSDFKNESPFGRNPTLGLDKSEGLCPD